MFAVLKTNSWLSPPRYQVWFKPAPGKTIGSMPPATAKYIPQKYLKVVSACKPPNMYFFYLP